MNWIKTKRSHSHLQRVGAEPHWHQWTCTLTSVPTWEADLLSPAGLFSILIVLSSLCVRGISLFFISLMPPCLWPLSLFPNAFKCIHLSCHCLLLMQLSHDQIHVLPHFVQLFFCCCKVIIDEQVVVVPVTGSGTKHQLATYESFGMQQLRCRL